MQMIADDTQDDLSMEDILSSIKDILDNETQTVPAPKAPAPVMATAPVVPNTPTLVSAPKPAEVVFEEDVYNLSKSMIIEDSLNDIDLGDDNDPIMDLGLEDIETNLDNIGVDEPLFADEGMDFLLPDIKEAAFEPIDTADSRETTPLFEVNDVEAEPIFSPEDEASANDLTSLSDDTPAIEDFMINRTFEETAEVEVELEPEPEPEPEPMVSLEELETPAQMIAPAAAVPSFAAKAAPTPIAEPKMEIMSAPKYEPQVEIKAALVVEEPKTGDMADVSAGIINNFAKMFASKQEEQEKVVLPVKADKLGNGSQTIEEVVKSVIREIIGDSVNAELDKNIDIDTFAKEEIKAQTKAWLEARLPSIVEASVQKEIERVMAKVGR